VIIIVAIVIAVVITIASRGVHSIVTMEVVTSLVGFEKLMLSVKRVIAIQEFSVNS
jgi:H+/gluconate symporter-like permease